MTRILLIDDDLELRDNLLEMLVEEGFEASWAGNGKSGVKAAFSSSPDLIVCDISMPVMDGRKVLEVLRADSRTAAVPFIFLTGRARREEVRLGMELGADDYLTKPCTNDELLGAIRGRLKRARGLAGPKKAAPMPEGEHEPVVRSQALRDVWARALRVAPTDIPVLVLGETGAGKEVLVKAIQRASARAGGPYKAINCGTIPENLQSSYLFGHEKGAFTGATERKIGLFESASGGTVFLDEIGELKLEVQISLLRVLQEGRLCRLGSHTEIEVDVRLISATNKDPRAAIAAGTFRQDLYYRIKGAEVTVPPLRERLADLREMVTLFSARMAGKLGQAPPTFSTDVLARLESLPWPGNVRELENAINYAVAFCDGGVVTMEDLPPEYWTSAAGAVDTDDDPGLVPPGRDAAPWQHGPVVWKDLSFDQKTQAVARALDKCAGNQGRAAELLGIARRTLIGQMDRADMPRPRKGRD